MQSEPARRARWCREWRWGVAGFRKVGTIYFEPKIETKNRKTLARTNNLIYFRRPSAARTGSQLSRSTEVVLSIFLDDYFRHYVAAVGRVLTKNFF